MSYIPETDDELGRRKRNGLITGVLALGWWVASIGGIIYMLNFAG